MGRKIRTAVIGCGKVGHFHAQSLQRCATSELVAVCGRTQEKTEAFARQYGVKGFVSVADMIRETGVEMASICTPHPLHREPAVQAAKLGVHVLIEKPLASTLADCDQILNAAADAKVKVGTVGQRRFFPASQRVKTAIQEGKIGKPILGTVTMLGWRDQQYYQSDPWRGTWSGEGGGVLVNQAPHQLDLLLWYMGEIESLYGIWDTLNHPYLEVDDTAAAVIRFKSGAIGNILVSNSQNPALYGKVHVYGENGASIGVQTDGGAMFIAGRSSIAEPPVNDIWNVPEETEKCAQWKREDEALFRRVNATYYFHDLQIAEFLDAILGDREPLITGLDGRRTVELFTAIYRAQETGKVISFPLRA